MSELASFSPTPAEGLPFSETESMQTSTSDGIKEASISSIDSAILLTPHR